MNRCSLCPSAFLPCSRTVLRSLLMGGIASSILIFSAPSVAQTVSTQTPVIQPDGKVLRPMPSAVRRADLEVVAPPVVKLNGKEARLSPGARIRGTNNMLVLPASLVGRKVTVNFLREPTGLIHEVWILTPDEIAQKIAKEGS